MKSSRRPSRRMFLCQSPHLRTSVQKGKYWAWWIFPQTDKEAETSMDGARSSASSWDREERSWNSSGEEEEKRTGRSTSLGTSEETGMDLNNKKKGTIKKKSQTNNMYVDARRKKKPERKREWTQWNLGINRFFIYIKKIFFLKTKKREKKKQIKKK